MKKPFAVLAFLAGAFLAGVALASAAWAAPVDEEAELRSLAQSLNSVRDDSNQQETKISELARDPARAKKLIAVARKMNDDKDSKLAYGANYILGNLALEVRDYSAGASFFARAVKQGEQLHSDKKIAMAYLRWIDMQTAAKEYDEAETLCKKLMERETEEQTDWVFRGKIFALQGLVHIAAYRGKIDEALTRVEALEVVPEFQKMTKAWVYHYAGRADEAIHLYEELLETVKDKAGEEKEKAAAHYARLLASMHGDKGDVDKATAVLEPLLKKSPDDAGLNNDLGYIYAEHGQKLDDAEKMIQKALKAEPENGSYIDSLAWVYYQQKKFDEAKKLQLKAVNLHRGKNAEILEHLGDIHAALGEKKEALAAWKEACDLATGSARDVKRKAEMEKKVKEMETK